ncbi:2,3-bisphosphoglycerate-independent phosphoglycerate mutase [Mesobacterium pallidum]|uniref:2,3-bisphosphoglycerate-independent phosphoglycerate mutase n=1 Tax=Mesobacterium pallidum TaxID=2872037 RepID=UPI001EE33732|nr:2,3-bisphosphoglycerate-independent phosphoglycerate mutase [Mesobacterium pallidum]
MTAPKPVVLCILDGWGLREATDHNAPALARTPNFDRIWQTCPTSTLITHGRDVGLPAGQMGNSEVGHMNIGAGRVVAMDLGQIDLAVEDGSFAKNDALQAFLKRLKASGGTAHLMGVVSDGGVHGHIEHVLAAARAVTDAGVRCVLHAVTDGRDVAPKSADGFLETLESRLPKGASVATVTGRYYAMDRDNRWERVEKAYDAMILGEGNLAPDSATAVRRGYGADKTDEFLPATVIGDYKGAKDGDGFFCLNFRGDRAREILRAIGEPEFAEFDTGTRPKWASLLGMVEYSDDHNDYMHTCYPKREIANTLAHWVAAKGLRQFHIAETEKYPHVTFFLNGGKETPEAGEDRYMAASPKVATYDLQPEMSAGEVTEHFVGAIREGYDLIVCNFANPDMVGHTGDLNAAIAACEAVDEGLGQVLEALEAAGGAMIVTADHGNCETMWDDKTNGPHTAHTTNPVPVILVGGPEGASLRDGGRLADLAPTLLALMQLDQPEEMTGESLLS